MHQNSLNSKNYTETKIVCKTREQEKMPQLLVYTPENQHILRKGILIITTTFERDMFVPRVFDSEDEKPLSTSAGDSGI